MTDSGSACYSVSGGRWRRSAAESGVSEHIRARTARTRTHEHARACTRTHAHARARTHVSALARTNTHTHTLIILDLICIHSCSEWMTKTYIDRFDIIILWQVEDSHKCRPFFFLFLFVFFFVLFRRFPSSVATADSPYISVTHFVFPRSCLLRALLHHAFPISSTSLPAWTASRRLT